MARYVLLEFDDNNDEEEFLAALSVKGGMYYMRPDGHMTNVEPDTVRLKAHFAKPTQFCECDVVDDRSPLGKKWGWRVHALCGKPKRGVCQHPRNLLDPIDMNPRDRMLYLGVWEGITTKNGSK